MLETAQNQVREAGGCEKKSVQRRKSNAALEVSSYLECLKGSKRTECGGESRRQ